MKTEKKPKDIRIFRHKTNKHEICELVSRCYPQELSRDEINTIVRKILTVHHAVNFLVKKYGKEIDRQIVFGDEANIRNFPADILHLAIEEIIHSSQVVKRENLTNVISLFSRKIR